MPKPILAGFDPKTRDRGPVDFGAMLSRVTGAPLVIVAVEARGPRLVAVSAEQSLPYAVGEAADDLLEDAGAPLEELEAELRTLGIRADYVRRPGTSAGRVLHEEAESRDAGLLVVALRKDHGDHRRLALTTAGRLVHGAPCPIVVLPTGWAARGKPRAIAVAYVDTEEGRAALRGAHALARRLDAPLHVMTVLDATRSAPDEPEDQVRVRVEEELRREAAALAGSVDVQLEVDVLVGDPVEMLVRAAQDVELLVCGSRGYGPLRAVMLGSVSERVVAEAPAPVLVVPRGVTASLDGVLGASPGAATRV